ncbi:MAG: N-acetyltransferase family protein [Dehalococcoidia bacterium]|nr:N-acetyltransferase family protein [Dehalococcoidia bacterium]
MDVHVHSALEQDLEAIQRIYKYEILTGTATWDLAPWPAEQRLEWWREHVADPSIPVVVAEVEGAVAGFAYLSIYRAKAGYRYTRETSVYVDQRFHRGGVGRALMEVQLASARALGLHALMAVIEAENAASIALHAGFGFERVALKREVGRKFGRWLDSVEMELLLPLEPPD